MKQKRRLIKPRKLRKQKSIKLNATDEEKAAAKAKVDEAVTTAKNAIDQTTNNVGVDAAKRVESNQSIKCNQRLLKRSSKAEIDNVAQAKKAEIDRKLKCDRRRKSSSKIKSR